MSAPRSSAGALGYALLSAAYVALVILWSLVIPFNGAPDEFTHFFLIEYLFLFRDMPVPGLDPAATFTGILSDYVYHPDAFWYYGLPYLNALLGLASASVLVDYLSAELAFLAPRAVNWGLAGVFFLSLLAIGRGLEVRPAALALLAIILAAVPQVTFVFAYFNADGFALATTTLSLAAFVWMLRTRSTRAAILLGAACGLVLCSKLYYFPAFVFYGTVLAFLGLLDRGPVLRPVLWAVGTALLVAGPYLALVYWQFGEITGMSGQVDFTEWYRGNADQRAVCFVLCEGRIIHWTNMEGWLGTTFRSYFYGLGWMTLFLEAHHYRVFFFPLVGLLFLVSLAVAGRDLVARALPWPERLWRPLLVVLFWSMAVCVVLANAYGSQELVPQPQGRYLFVTIPFAFLMACALAGAPRVLLRTGPAARGGPEGAHKDAFE